MSIPVSALDNLVDLTTPPEEIKWRAGQRLHADQCAKPCTLPHAMLAYIDARYVMKVLDSLVGPANWQRVHLIGDGGKVACGVGIHILTPVTRDEGGSLVPGHEEWIWKWDGAGETDIEGEKGSFSDAFKRAAVCWGIGRDLYAMKPSSQPQAAPRPTPVSAQAGVGSQPEFDEFEDEGYPLSRAADEFAPIGGQCPVHHKAWFLQPAGTSKNNKPYGAFWKCTGAPRDEPFCDEKPSKAWQAAHER